MCGDTEAVVMCLQHTSMKEKERKEIEYQNGNFDKQIVEDSEKLRNRRIRMEEEDLDQEATHRLDVLALGRFARCSRTRHDAVEDASLMSMLSAHTSAR